MCGVLLKCIVTSQVFLLIFIDDLWFLNLTLNSVVVEPIANILEIAFFTVDQINDIS